MAWNYSDTLIRGMLGEPTTHGSLATLMKDGKIELRDGAIPATPETAATGTLLATITLNGDPYTSGNPGPAANGLKLALDGATLILKRASGETWKGTGLAAAGASPGTNATWCRWTADNDGTVMVMDGNVGTSGSDLNMTNGTAIVEGVDAQVSDVTITLTSV